MKNMFHMLLFTSLYLSTFSWAQDGVEHKRPEIQSELVLPVKGIEPQGISSSEVLAEKRLSKAKLRFQNISVKDSTDHLLQGILEQGGNHEMTSESVCKRLNEVFEKNPELDPNDILRDYNWRLRKSIDNSSSSIMSLIMARTIERYTKHSCKKGALKSCKVKALQNYDRFPANCKEVADYLLKPGTNLDDEFELGLLWENSDKSGKKPKERGVNITVGGKTTCLGLGDGNCVFFKEDNFQEGCNKMECTTAGENPVGDDLSDLANKLVNFYETDWIPKGDHTFCVDCLGKSYDALEDKEESFSKARRDLEKDVENAIAGKAAGQRLFDVIGEVEHLVDVQFMNKGKEISSKSCFDSVQNVFDWSKDPCEGAIDRETFKKRADMALKEARLDYRVGSNQSLVLEMLQKVNPSKDGHSCREALVAKRKLDFYKPKNRKYISAMSSLLNEAKNNPEMREILTSENCSTAGGSREPFVKLLSEKLSNKVLEKVGGIIGKNWSALENLDDKSDDKIDQKIGELICSSEDHFTKQVFCPSGTISESVFKSALEKISAYKKTYLKRHKSDLEAAKANLPDGQVQDYVNIELESIREYTQNLYQAEFQNILNLGMKMDPALRANLGSWKAVCSNFKKAESIDAPLISFFRDNLFDPTGEELEKKATASCNESVDRLKGALCGSGFLRADKESGKDGLGYSQKDFTHALDSVLDGTSSPSKNLLGRSLSCEIFSQPVNLGYDKSTRFDDDSKTSWTSGIPGAWSDYKRDTVVNELNQDGAVRMRQGLGLGTMMAHSCDASGYHEALSYLSPRPKNNFKDDEDGEAARATDLRISEAVNSQPIIAGSGESFPPNYFDPTGSKGNFSNSISTTSKGRSVAKSGDIPGAGNDGGRSIASSSAPEPVTNSSTAIGNTAVDVSSNSSNVIGNTPISSPMPYSAYDPTRVSAASVSDEDLSTAISSSNKDQTAQDIMAKAGMSNDPEIKQMLKELLEGKKRDDKIAELEEQIKNDRKAHQEQIKSLEEILEEQKAAVKNEKGKVVVPETKDVKRLASNSDFVVNTRSLDKPNAPVEFVNKSYYTSGPGKASVSPDFSETSKPERVSLADYSASRRSAASARMSAAANKVNQGINTSFLQSFDTSTYSREDGTIDYGSYARNYVAHIAKNAGSIEHLVIYNAEGRPDKIRVPDPKRQDEFVEVEIPEDLKEEILQQVSKDEFESFQIYEMVNFGGSLLETLEAQKKEVKELEQSEKDLTMLSALNARLESLREL